MDDRRVAFFVRTAEPRNEAIFHRTASKHAPRSDTGTSPREGDAKLIRCRGKDVTPPTAWIHRLADRAFDILGQSRTPAGGIELPPTNTMYFQW